MQELAQHTWHKGTDHGESEDAEVGRKSVVGILIAEVPVCIVYLPVYGVKNVAKAVDNLGNDARDYDGVTNPSRHQEVAKNSDSIKAHLGDKACDTRAQEAGHGEVSGAVKFWGMFC